MIVLKVTMLEGRAAAQKSELMLRLTEAAARHLNEPADSIRLMIYEIPASNWGAGGISIEESRKSAGGA